MKKLILAAAFIAAVNFAQAQQQYQERDYIEVNARASREVTPDEIFLSITLDQNDTKGKYTIDQLEKQLYNALKAAGVDADKELRVSDMSSQLKSYLLKKNEGRIAKDYILKVTNEQLMPVFRELDKAALPTASISSSRYSKLQDLYDELLAEAVAKAKTRATLMAQAAGQPLGGMIYAQTYDNSSAYDGGMATNVMMFKSRAAGMVMDEAAPTFEFNKQRVEVNVTTRFTLLGKK